MKAIRIAFGMLAIVACGVAQEAAAQKGELDVTMRVLDDVRDVDAVIVAIGAPEETTARDDAKGARAAPAPRAADSAPLAADADDTLEPRDETEVEAALEDREVAEDEEPVEPVN